MKTLIIINGAMGVGKTTTSRELQKLLPKSVFLDGDWCWCMSPFIVTDETKNMVLGNICYLLNSFLSCTEFENILFCWVMHEQQIIDDVLSRLNTKDCGLFFFSLVCSEDALSTRIEEDIQKGTREPGIAKRSLEYLRRYAALNTVKIDVSEISAEQAAEIIHKQIFG